MGMTITLDDVSTESLKRIAALKSCDPEAVVRDLISEKADEEEWNKRTLAAFEHFKQTGLHVTYEEIDAWLAKLEAGEDAEPPECHK